MSMGSREFPGLYNQASFVQSSSMDRNLNFIRIKIEERSAAGTKLLEKESEQKINDMFLKIASHELNEAHQQKEKSESNLRDEEGYWDDLLEKMLANDNVLASLPKSAEGLEKHIHSLQERCVDLLSEKTKKINQAIKNLPAQLEAKKTKLENDKIKYTKRTESMSRQAENLKNKYLAVEQKNKETKIIHDKIKSQLAIVKESTGDLEKLQAEEKTIIEKYQKEVSEMSEDDRKLAELATEHEELNKLFAEKTSGSLMKSRKSRDEVEKQDDLMAQSLSENKTELESLQSMKFDINDNKLNDQMVKKYLTTDEIVEIQNTNKKYTEMQTDVAKDLQRIQTETVSVQTEIDENSKQSELLEANKLDGEQELNELNSQFQTMESEMNKTKSDDDEECARLEAEIAKMTSMNDEIRKEIELLNERKKLDAINANQQLKNIAEEKAKYEEIFSSMKAQQEKEAKKANESQKQSPNSQFEKSFDLDESFDIAPNYFNFVQNQDEEDDESGDLSFDDPNKTIESLNLTPPRTRRNLRSKK